MADYSVTVSTHKTLVASTADKVTFTGGDPEDVEILNRGSDDIYVTVNGPVPTVAGDNTYVVTAGGSVVLAGGSVVQLISAGAAAYSVSRVEE